MDQPERWGLPRAAVRTLGQDLKQFWQRFRSCFHTRTRDASGHAYTYWRGQLTMETERNFANIERTLQVGGGQNLQQFVSDSPWSARAVWEQIGIDLKGRPELQRGGLLILDESADEKAGEHSAGAARQYNGRQGKVDLCQVGVGLVFAHPASRLWVLVDGELFLPQEWFDPQRAALRQELGIPPERRFQTKLDLGLAMVQRARQTGLPFERVACDDFYGRDSSLRAALAALPTEYAAHVPANTQVWLRRPKANEALAAHAKTVEELAFKRSAVWKERVLRPCERGQLKAHFLVKRVWTRTEPGQWRQEWLVIRNDASGKLTYVLSNAPKQTPAESLCRDVCQREWVERTFQDCKSELGWDEFCARKYRAWEHHLALTAAALWFVAEVKLNWHQQYPRDPQLLEQFELEVLPALSTANVRQLLQAVLPLPQLTSERARTLVARHLVNRARSTQSRLRDQQPAEDSG